MLRYFFKKYLIITIFYIPWIFVIINQISAVKDNGFWLHHTALNVLSTFAYFFISNKYIKSNSDIFLYFLSSIVILGYILLPLGIIYSLKKKKNIAIFFLSFIVFVFFLSFITPFFYIRYLLFLVPFVLILTVKGAIFLDKYFKNYSGTIVLTLLSILTVVLYIFYISNNTNNKVDYKSIVGISDEYNENIIILHPSVKTFNSFKYYSHQKNFVYDPDRNTPYWYGTASLTDKDYYDNNFNKDEIEVVYFYKYPKLYNELIEHNYQLKRNYNYDNINVDIYYKN